MAPHFSCVLISFCFDNRLSSGIIHSIVSKKNPLKVCLPKPLLLVTNVCTGIAIKQKSTNVNHFIGVDEGPPVGGGGGGQGF